ncbi:hypothetical protein DMENIID0001_131630 [Sergentomyia squamirostris]
MKKNQLNIHKPTCSCSWLTTSISHSASVHENPPKRNEPTAPQNDDLDASVLFVSEYSNANPPVINLCSPEPPTRHGHQVCENTTVQASSPDRFKCTICLRNMLPWKPHSTACGHFFCLICIAKVMETSQKCPVCRKTLDARGIHPIYP